jgi:uncharacterized membrane protein
MTRAFTYKKLLQYFLQGLLIMAPLAITAYAIYWVITSVDSLLPIFTYKDAQGNVKVQNYGIGLLIIVGVLVLIGYFSSFFITTRLVNFVDRVLERTPGIKYIYSTTRDFFEAFAGDKKKFTQNVLANVDDNDVWRFGFITKDDMADFGLHNYVTVYIPMAYSVAGNVYVIPKQRVKPITNINAAQTMKFAVSGGITDFDDDENEKSK